MLCGLIHRPAPPAVPLLADRADLSIAVPAECNYQAAIDVSDPLGNATKGSCFPVSMWRSAEVRLHAAGRYALVPTEAAVDGTYEQVGNGFDPADKSTWQVGTDAVRGMTWWCQQGIQILPGLLDIVQWTKGDPANVAHVKAGIYLTGGACLSLNLPRAAAEAAIWNCTPGSDPDTAPGSYAAHRVFAGRYDDYGLWGITWGQEVCISWAFLAAYGLACDFVLSWDFFDTTGVTPAGLDRERLAGEMAGLVG